MIGLALWNLWARRGRLLSTLMAVVIGVAFLSGSLVLIDTIGRTFDDLLVDVNDEIDVEVRSTEVVETPIIDVRGQIDDDVLDTVLAVDGVRTAVGGVAGYAQLVDPAGEPMGNPGQGAPTLGFGWTDVEEVNPMILVEGRAPEGPDEVVIDRRSARDGPFDVGDAVTILLQAGPRPFTVTGVATFGQADSPLGASVVLFEPATAQELLAEPGRFDVIDIVADDGVSAEDLRDRVAAVLPDEAEAITGEQLVEENRSDVAEALSFFNTFMLIFSAVALFVAAFIIYNTFSILVAQRTRELALLRALGAGRGQVVASVVVEALLVGLVASLVGIVAGIGVAQLLEGLLAAVGLAIPATGFSLQPATVGWSLAVGVGITAVSALGPARRSGSVAPLAAIRASVGEQARFSPGRLLVGVGAMVVGIGLLWWGLFGSSAWTLPLIGVGAAAVFLALAGLAPLVAVPFSGLLGRPLAWLQAVPGELARENAMRNPRRTATTAAALMIGVGLVITIAIFAASAKASIERIIDDSFVGDVVVDSGTAGVGGLSPRLAAELAERPEVDAATGIRVAFAEIGGDAALLYSVDPAVSDRLVDVGVVAGSVEAMGATDLAVHTETAAAEGLDLGDTVTVTFPDTGDQALTVAALFEIDDLTGSYFIAHPAFDANVPEAFDVQVWVLGDDGFNDAEVIGAVEDVAAGYPNADVQDLTEFKRAQTDQIDQILNLVYALLALAVVIALIGIANTLALSILERTHELGLLRAIGMTRSQLRSSIRLESVLIALLGTVLGAAVGTFFGWVVVLALRDDGFTELRFPIDQLVGVLALSIVAAVVAAAQPARRAARMNILDAVAAD